jgi:hypothetical protein
MVSTRWSGLACDVVRQIQAGACVKTGGKWAIHELPLSVLREEEAVEFSEFVHQQEGTGIPKTKRRKDAGCLSESHHIASAMWHALHFRLSIVCGRSGFILETYFVTYMSRIVLARGPNPL